MTTNQTEPTTNPNGRGGSNPLVLLAEDDAVQRIALTRLLEREGYDVVAAENGAGAIALADEYQPDLVLIDAVMPQMGGFEAIAAMRSRPGLATTPTIVISGLEDVDSRVNALAVGADDFITKPVDPGELVARVRARLRNVDAWYGRVNTMIGNFRSIRRRIGDAERVTDPAAAARSLLPRFPAELGCSTLVTIDATGRREWASEPFFTEDLDAVDFHAVPARGASTTLAIEGRSACPLCGAATGGALVAIEAGTWELGRAVLLVGCVDRLNDDRRSVATEVADACGFVLGERMRDWQSDLELTRWLDGVIDTRAFQIAFQPIVDMRSGRIIAQEALTRFDDGTAPGEALRAAVALDRRIELELIMVEVALEQAIALPDGVRVHVNVSPATALTPELSDLVADTRRRVVLEITEDALFTSANAATLRSSIPASCLLAADDVGAGYAGMAQLLEYRPDIVKIDRAVVSNIDTDPARQALVAGLVQFAQATRSFVVGEGVERREEWEALRELGVDFGQGYHFSRPMSLTQAAQLSHCEPGARVSSRRRSLRDLVAG